MSKRRRFVRVETTRLDLSDGDWIEVKNELAYGERLALNNAAMIGQRDGMAIVDYGRFHLKRLELYLVDWNLADEHGKNMPLQPDTIESLDEESAAEINRALDAHIAKMWAEQNDGPAEHEAEPEKNARSA